MEEPDLYSWETVEYSDSPELPDVEKLEQVEDFLPPPEQLVFKQPTDESAPPLDDLSSD